MCDGSRFTLNIRGEFGNLKITQSSVRKTTEIRKIKAGRQLVFKEHLIQLTTGL